MQAKQFVVFHFPHLRVLADGRLEELLFEEDSMQLVTIKIENKQEFSEISPCTNTCCDGLACSSPLTVYPLTRFACRHCLPFVNELALLSQSGST